MVNWCHLGDLRFTAPFFEQTIGQAMRHPFNLLFGHSTPLAEVAARADEPSDLTPSGFIFHMSRCGSTVISQMLAALPQNVVLSEPAPLDHILRIPDRIAGVPEAEVMRCLRGMVAALGRRRRAGEQNLFIKFDAWHVLRLPLVRRAFPQVPWIFVYRDPIEVLASLALSRPSQMFGSTSPALLGKAAEELSSLTADQLSTLVLDRYCGAAIEHCRDGGLLIEYRELPDVVCSKMLSHFGLRYGEGEIAAMRTAAQADAKRPDRPFQPDGETKRQGASDELRGLAERLAPLYAQLEALRRAQ